MCTQLCYVDTLVLSKVMWSSEQYSPHLVHLPQYPWGVKCVRGITHHLQRNQRVTNRLNSLPHCLFNCCNAICLFHNMVYVNYYIQRSKKSQYGDCRWPGVYLAPRVSMVVADGLEPIWRQDICNHPAGAGWALHLMGAATLWVE